MKEQIKDDQIYYILLDEVQMLGEFMSVYDGNKYDGWNEYITYGGIPLVVLADTEEQKVALLENLFKETYLSDIVKRYNVRNVGEMDALLNILSSAIGALTNPNKLQKTFKKIVITSNTPKPFYTDEGILMMNVFDFLLSPDSLEQ